MRAFIEAFDMEVADVNEQGVALNTCPAASSIRHDHSTLNPQSKPRPRAGVRGLRRWAKNGLASSSREYIVHS